MRARPAPTEARPGPPTPSHPARFDGAAEDEEQVRETVQVAHHLRVASRRPRSCAAPRGGRRCGRCADGRPPGVPPGITNECSGSSVALTSSHACSSHSVYAGRPAGADRRPSRSSAAAPAPTGPRPRRAGRSGSRASHPRTSPKVPAGAARRRSSSSARPPCRMPPPAGGASKPGSCHRDGSRRRRPASYRCA